MVASNLTVSQLRALAKLVYRVWKSAYDMQETRGTLDSLVNKGLAERSYSGGFGFSGFERTSTFYRLPSEREQLRG